MNIGEEWRENCVRKRKKEDTRKKKRKVFDLGFFSLLRRFYLAYLVGFRGLLREKRKARTVEQDLLFLACRKLV